MNLADKLYESGISFAYMIEKDSLYFGDNTMDPFSIIVVSGEEHCEPRFHLFNSDGSFNSCIGLLEPVYFDFKNEHDHLHADQVRILIDRLSEFDCYCWRDCIYQWYIENDYYDLSDNTSKLHMPDYTQLPD